MKKSCYTNGILFVLFHLTLTRGDVSQEAKDLATKWAPLVWLHPDELFYPSNIDFFLDNSEMRDEFENVLQTNVNTSNILRGPDSGNLHLNTFEDLECVRCTRPHFYGQPIEKVKLHALIKEWGDACNTIDVAYPTFYPYNYGKDVCIGADPGGFCLGAKPTFGNHVSDWEHSSLRLQNGLPIRMYLAVHSFGSTYVYASESNQFQFEKGDSYEMRGDTFKIEFPQTINIVEDTHPEVFSANGSHGTWADTGKHNYFNFFIHLDDYCGRGTPWKVWENIQFLDASLPDSSYSGDLSWIDFQGRWGNTKKMMCEVEPFVGECGITPGVAGPGTDWGMGHFERPPVCVQ